MKIKDKLLKWTEYQSAVHIISLGAGVQSSTMAEMAAAGEITPMPIAAYFADTQAEPASVYKWLDWLEKRLPFPVYRVTDGSLEDAELEVRRSKRSGKLYSNNKIPAYIKGEGMVDRACSSCDEEEGDRPDCGVCRGLGVVQVPAEYGLLGRKCTKDFKITPIRRAIRKQVGIFGERCEEVKVIQWMGFSTDEAGRVKESREPWLINRHPLLEKKMTRFDCTQYFAERGYPEPPRSACYFCPFHNDTEWRRLKTDEPEEFSKAVAFEGKLQASMGQSEVIKGVPYLHASRQPLASVDFDALTLQKRAQLNLFQNECEGMCGL